MITPVKHFIEIGFNAEGDKLARMSPVDQDGNSPHGFRIAGPKAWGGFSRKASIDIRPDDLARYVLEYAPEVLEKIEQHLKQKAERQAAREQTARENSAADGASPS